MMIRAREGNVPGLVDGVDHWCHIYPVNRKWVLMRKRGGTSVALKTRPRKSLMMTGVADVAAGPSGHAGTSALRAGALRAGAATTVDFSELDETAALQNAVQTRAGEGLQQIIAAVSRDRLYQALSTKTPVDALIHIVSSESAVAHAATVVDDPLRAARARAAQRMADLLAAEGGPLGVEDVSAVLRITRAAVDKRRRAGTLIGVDDGGRAVLYPSWQFRDTGSLPGLDDVLRALDIRDPWMRIEFFLSPDPDIGGRPLDVLRDGRKAEVIAAAKRYGRHGEDG